ncbi:MAG: hypothetical protein LQ346_008541, partial [Caloplaca aetnensis]
MGKGQENSDLDSQKDSSDTALATTVDRGLEAPNQKKKEQDVDLKAWCDTPELVATNARNSDSEAQQEISTGAANHATVPTPSALI